MNFQVLKTIRKPYLRLAATSLIALQTAVIGTAVSEFIATQPQFLNARMAFAQGNQVQAAEDATVYIETDKGSGSGVIVSSDGLVVTNAHVLEGARQLKVMVQGRQYSASIVSMGQSDCLDLALIQIDGAQNLPTVPFGDIHNAFKTQAIYAIGFPLGLSKNSATITRGIISNIHSDLSRIQLDSPLNPGNSGGPIVDSEGNLVGIATSGRGNDVNFAVSVDKVSAFVSAYRQDISIPFGIMPGSQPDGGTLAQTINLDGGEVQGLLQNQDSQYCADGSLADLYTFEANAGESIMLNMSSQDMGTFLFLLDPNGNAIARSGNQERDQSTVIIEKLPQTGTYTVVANAASQGESGHYQLRATQPLLVEDGAIYSGDRPCFDGGQRCLSYQFLGSAQQTITLLLHYAEFDPYLMLIDPAGEVIDEAPTDRQAIASYVLEQDGWYTIVVGTRQPEESGNFAVSVHDAQMLNPQTEVSQR